MILTAEIAYAVIERLRASSNDLQSVANNLIAEMGFQTYMLAGLPSPGQELGPLVLATGWPEVWQRWYFERGYGATDPCIERARSSSDPFYWRAFCEQSQSALLARILSEAAEFGIADGITIPVHVFPARPGFFGLVTDGQELSVNEVAYLQILGLMFYSIARDRHVHTQASLTDREKEVLKRLSEGRNTEQIGELLGIAAPTVIFHLNNASRKLHAVNRVHAVVKAIRQGLISP